MCSSEWFCSMQAFPTKIVGSVYFRVLFYSQATSTKTYTVGLFPLSLFKIRIASKNDEPRNSLQKLSWEFGESHDSCFTSKDINRNIDLSLKKYYRQYHSVRNDRSVTQSRKNQGFQGFRTRTKTKHPPNINSNQWLNSEQSLECCVWASISRNTPIS